MKYVRAGAEPDYVSGLFEAQVLYRGESAWIFACTVGAGGQGPAQHIHEFSDQIYYIVSGEMTVQLGTEVFTAGPDTMVFIPRGTPHHNWNEGSVDEVHLEIIAPPPGITQAVSTPTTSTEAGGRPYLLRRLDDAGSAVGSPFSTTSMLRASDQSHHVNLAVDHTLAGTRAGTSDTTFHNVDEFCYVLEGELRVEVASQRVAAHPGDLVVIPAGVPHRLCNADDIDERHIAVRVPSQGQACHWRLDVAQDDV